MSHKSGKWALELLAGRDNEGMWGNFHALSMPVPGKKPTTEQALRRLRALGFAKDDEPVKRVMERMCLCVTGARKIDGYSEKMHDWRLFEKLMLGAWIRVFDPENEVGLSVARTWAEIAEAAFADGIYNEENDIAAFRAVVGRPPKSGFETGFGMFYHAALLPGALKPKTERAILEYFLTRPGGMYYIYDKPLNIPPANFASRETSRYIAAIETLAVYPCAREQLGFVREWLNAARGADGQWDMGAAARDGAYLPLSDSWRDKSARKRDCTERITALITRLDA